MDHRTNFRSLVSVLVIAMLCISVAPALGKGKPPKPDPDPPTRPNVNYDITWLSLSSVYNELVVRDVNPQGTTIVGSTTTGGMQAAATIDAATGAIVDLNTIVPGILTNWRLISALDITHSGRIAGELIDDLGQRGLYVYDPLDADPFQTFAMGYGIYRDMNENGDVLYVQGGGTPNSYIYTYDKVEVPLPESLMPPTDRAGSRGPTAINNNRLIAGNFEGTSDATAFTYDYNTDTTTTIEPFFRSLDMNNAGDVVGRGELVSKGGPYVKATMYRSTDGTKTLLTDTIVSTARDINDFGQVVGTMFYPKHKGSHGQDVFLYDPDPSVGFWALADLIEDPDPQDASYWVITNGAGVNDGRIAVSEPLQDGYPLIVGHKRIPGSEFEDGIQRYSPYILTPSIPNSAATAALTWSTRSNIALARTRSGGMAPTSPSRQRPPVASF